MEQHAENAAIISLKLEANKPLQPRLKRQGSKNIFNVALIKIRGRSQKTKALPADNGSKSIWRKLVGSMRPMHLQSGESPTKNRETHHSMSSDSSTEHGEERFDSMPNSPPSPSLSPSPSSSRYASAIGLNELVQGEDSGEEEKEEKSKVDNNNGDGDETIDAKAEDFIATFYLQMKLQRFNTADSHYKEISKRSLGL